MSQKKDVEAAAAAEKRDDAPIEEAEVMVDAKVTDTVRSTKHAVKVDRALKPKVEKALADNRSQGRKKQIEAATGELRDAAERLSETDTVGRIDVYIAGKVNGRRFNEHLQETPKKRGQK